MKKDKNSERKNLFQQIFYVSQSYVKENWPSLIVFLCTFIVATAFAFVRVATMASVSSYSIDSYEVGQVADKTIIAGKSLPATTENPISITKGERIIRKGFMITEDEYAKLRVLAESPVYIDYRAFANSLLYLMLIGALYFFLYGETCLGYKIKLKEQITGSVFFLVTYAFAIFSTKLSSFPSNMMIAVLTPGIFFTYLIAILFSQRNAVYFSFLISFSVLNVCESPLLPFFYLLSSTLAASRIVKKISRRIDMLVASFVQCLLNIVFLIIIKIIFNSVAADLFFLLPGVAFNGFISAILCLGFITPIELLLNTASVFRLMDLNDLSTPTLKKLQLNATGTYSHSVMVAHLAEAACSDIGANGLLARVGAYYHDIGKMDNPEYFTENQTGSNIHNEIKPSLSVSIIRSHVKNGLEKARALRLPDRVLDIIAEHHGNQVISYFYNSAKEKDPNVNPADYSYNGNPPTSKESAVVMLADTVEAACRSFDNPSVSRIDKFTQELMDAKVNARQLDNCNLTFKELNIIHSAFVQILAGYYHSRIKYPEQKDPDTGKSEKNPSAEKEEKEEGDKEKENA